MAEANTKVNEVSQSDLDKIKSKTIVPPQELSNGDLPWAMVALPTTSSGLSAGGGQNQHGLQPGTWVIGYFLDGDSCQMPIITGVLAGGPGAGTTGGGSGTGGTGSADGGTGESGGIEKGFRKLISIGFNEVQAAGIIGNLISESGINLNTGAKGDSGTAHGIAQWRFDRWENMKKFARTRNPPKSEYDFETQVEFIKHEMENYPSNTGYARILLNNARTPEDAASAFANFEKPKGYRFQGVGKDGSAGVHDIAKRRAQARKVYENYKQNRTVPNDNTGVAPGGT